MANSSNIFLNAALVISLVLVITVAEARSVIPVSTSAFPGSGDRVLRAASKVNCDAVVSVAKGDTCFDIANSFKLSTDAFNAINPNLNCDALFIGQWVCVDGF